MSPFYQYEEQAGFNTLLETQVGGPGIIGFAMLSLKIGQTFRDTTGQKETILVILSGKCKVSASGNQWDSIGERKSVFDGKPYAVYLPCNSEYEVLSLEDVEIAVCSAASNSKRPARLIGPEDVKILSRGQDNWYRDVCEIANLGEDADSLIVGETISGPGNWCSYPPHKHDLEEMYFFKVNPPQGFGIQRVYTDDKKLDELYLIRNNSLVAIPQGYHPLVAAPGYSVWFLYVLAAGPGQKLQAYNDPDHSWLSSGEGK